MNSTQQPVLKTESKTIDGMSFECTVFPAMYGLKIKGRLLKLVGPALGSLVQGLKTTKGGSILDANFDMSVIGPAIATITDHFDDPKVVQLIQDVFSSTRVDGQPMSEPVMNIKFAGNYTILYKAIIFVVETNRFFGKGSIGDLIAGANIPTKPTTSGTN